MAILENAEFVYSVLAIAPVVSAVAFFAYCCRNRTMMIVGLLACFSGLLFDRGGSTGGYLDHSMIRAQGFAAIGLITAFITCTITYFVTKREKPFQFSIGFLILLLTATGIVAAIWRQIAG